MNLHKLSNAKELLAVASMMNLDINILPKDEGKKYISDVINKYHPWKMEGHLSIGDNTYRVPTEENEFSFSSKMKSEPAFIFFEQNYINKNDVVVIMDASNISPLMKNSYGMEYFISNREIKYLIAVNWYSIEYKGNVCLHSKSK